MEEEVIARTTRYARECIPCGIAYVNVPSDATMPTCHQCNRPILKIRTERPEQMPTTSFYFPARRRVAQ